MLALSGARCCAVQVHKILYPTLSGVLGAQTVLFAKCTAELVKATGTSE